LRIESVLLILVIVISLVAITAYLPQQSHQQTPPSELILSTRHFFDLKTGNMKALGLSQSAALANFHLNPANCSGKSLAIYVHGVWATEQEAEEQYNRSKDSYHEALKAIDSSIEPMPVILYSWDSNTPFDPEGKGWRIAKGIADKNGQFLANSILKLSNDCNSNVGIHIIAHSLGARVVLNALDELNNTNFRLESVHLMGAAVDDEEVSKNPNDNRNSINDDGIVYGDAIEKHVKKFYNLYNPEDDMLERLDPYEGWEVYPLYEKDDALGSWGIQNTSISRVDLPSNYNNETNVKNEIPKNTSINFTDADGDRKCDIFPSNCIISTNAKGDNHLGYMGFRDNISKRIVDDGVMDIVAKNWIAS
jgi:hypothetical protein